ncbi:MAG: tetratricopeptide repeat protein [Burkholderiaceae bacterium]
MQALVDRVLHGLMEQATAHHRGDRLAAAQGIYLAVLNERPGHADANHNLGVIALCNNEYEDALRHFRNARDAEPGNWQYWISLVDALIQARNPWGAAQVLEDARQSGMATAAVEELVERLLAEWDEGTPSLEAPGAAPDPSDIVAITQLINAQRYAEVESAAASLARRCADNPFAWRMWSLALLEQGRSVEAVEPLRQVARLCPEDADCLDKLGLGCVNQGRLVPAEIAFARAVQFAPDKSTALSNLGLALQRQGRLPPAEAVLRRCIALDDSFHVAHLNLSVVLDEMGRSDEAEAAVRRAIALHPAFAQAHNSLGYLLKDQGRFEETEASMRRAIALDPGSVAAQDNLLFVLNYHPDKSAEEIFEAYRDFDARFGLPLRVHWRAHANDRNPHRRLRIGYVCPSFSQHSTRHFLEPLLARHDHARVEVLAYSELMLASDATTQRYRGYFEHWVATAGMSDEALAQRIRDDGVDVLVDIAGHTRGNRLGAFARKPAPVSLHWLDYGYTTGLSAIDYYLTDPASAPPGSDALFAEAPWRLPVPAFVYRPNPEMGEVGPLPADENGYVTFGTLTRAIRINHHAIRVWAAILQRVEGSRLVVDSGNFRSTAAQEALAQQFLAHGIARERLEIGCHSPPWDVLRGIDIGLDCFPHNSGTTLFEMLYMGIPFVTLAGRPSVGRLGSSILHGIDQTAWIAHSEQEYVEEVVALAHDHTALAATRAALRARMQASPLMDEGGFARHVEDAYAQMFARWSGTQADAEGMAEYDTTCPASDSASDLPPAAVYDPAAVSTAASVAAEEPEAALHTVHEDRMPAPDDPLKRVVHQTMDLALGMHRAGEVAQAEDLYRAVLALAPAHADANHNLGVLALETGHASDSLPFFRTACTAQPENWQYWLSCFDALLHAGERVAATQMLEQKRRFGMAVPALQELIERLVESRFAAESESRVAHAQVPGPAKREGRHKAKPERASEHQVACVEALFKQNKLGEVVRQARAMTLRHPQHAFGWKALGAALVNQGEFDASLEPLQKAVDCSPGDAGALSNLGFALQNRQRPVQAEVNLRVALRFQPNFAPALINLGSTVLGQDRLDEAARLFQQGLAIEPGYIPAHSHLAQVFDEQGRLIEAAAGFRKTLDLIAASGGQNSSMHSALLVANAHQGLCSTQAKLADYGNAVAESDAALAVLPEDSVLWEKRLYAFSYHPDLPVEQIFSEFVRWGDRFALPSTDFSRHDRTPGRRMRVGYVSPDFRGHTSRFYFLPFFGNHDHAVVELFAYSNVKVEDACTKQFKDVFHHWRDIRGVPDEDVAAMVRADGIDILVDGCNHMRDDRLGVFTLKPAPLQVTWLGAAWTTGLRAVDYVLFDRYIAPPETVARESIVRLPHCFVPFQSMAQNDLPQPPPCLKNGYLTFAYSGRTERLNHHTFRVWGEILRRLPTARLVLDFRHFADPLNQQHFRALMARHGLDVERVVMRNSSNIFKGLHDFDILLDCFPHSGGTMLVDALWMGVPALTLASRPPLGRIGTSFVTNIGLPQWVAHSEQEYIDKACVFGSDTQGLASLRAGMRQRMLGSHLMDGKGFARGVESAYRMMWERFCAGLSPAPLTVTDIEAVA